jgi:hypothetical protein
MASGGFPKEPRQLMINLMYLVLTALLRIERDRRDSACLSLS